MDSRNFGPIVVLLVNLGLFALIGYLCWLFKNGWPTLLILFMMSYKSDKDNKDENSGNMSDAS